ncbi:MAG: class I SAM-dependent methyltransferase [bacterium]|nr:class I SAM-dependent methyltransferase [bacterium]
MAGRRALILPSRTAIAQSIDNGTSEDYHLVRLYYSWYSGWFYRNRLQMVADMLGDARYQRVLEVGVGSGIFVKHMLGQAEQVAGIDIHESYNGVTAMLKQEQVDLSRVELKQGSIFDIPYADNTFDAAVCISVLEHFEDPRPALTEMRRVVKPGGIFALGFPARNNITNALFGALGYRSHDIHPASHETILAAIRDTLTVEAVKQFPPGPVPMYVACKARKPS